MKVTKTDGQGNEHEVEIPDPTPEQIERMEAEAAARFRKVMGTNAHASEQRRRIINRHRVACNDLEGMDPAEVAAIRAAQERRERRAAKRK